MDPLLLAGLLGGIGGATRGVVGLFKAMTLKKRIVWSYFGVTCITAIVIGAFTGMVFNFDPRLSLLAGYAGTDVIEGLYKTFAVQKVLVR